MRKRDGIIVWPAYLDSTLTRTQGRRVPSNLAAPEVTVEILKEAAEAISLEYELESDKLFPRAQRGQKGQGYLVVSNPQGHKKKRLLLMLAKGVRRAVAKRESAKQAAAKKKKSKKGKKGKGR
ncbi:MAG: signal recognition particle subunit SRP19/SEC65 family protein [Candidatus Thorarchaeota archaeon]